MGVPLPNERWAKGHRIAAAWRFKALELTDPGEVLRLQLQLLPEDPLLAEDLGLEVGHYPLTRCHQEWRGPGARARRTG